MHLFNTAIAGGCISCALWIAFGLPRNIYSDVVMVVLLLVAAWRLW